MVSFAFFELKCPRCGLSYPQLLPDDGPVGEGVETTLPCLSCGDRLRKERKLSPTEAPACDWRPGGG